jgi:preprotein translocase subunit Sss1
LQQQYQAEARKARRAAQRQKEKEREELMEAIAWSLSGMAAIGGVGALIYFLGRYMEKW